MHELGRRNQRPCVSSTAMADRLHEMIWERAHESMTRGEILARFTAKVESRPADHRRGCWYRTVGEARGGWARAVLIIIYSLWAAIQWVGAARWQAGYSRTEMQTRSSSRWRGRYSPLSGRRLFLPASAAPTPFRAYAGVPRRAHPHRLQRRAELPDRRVDRRHVPGRRSRRPEWDSAARST